MKINKILNSELYTGDNQFYHYYENDRDESCDDRAQYANDYWDYIMDGEKCAE